MQGKKKVRQKSRHRHQCTSDTIFDVSNTIVMLFMLVIFAYPIYFVLIASISDPMLVNSGQVILIPKGLSFGGYERIFENEKIVRAYANTIAYTVVGTGINVALTISGGYVLSRKDLPGRGFLTLLFVVTMFFDGGMIPNYLIVRNLRLYNTFWAMVIPNALSVWNLMLAKSFFETSIPGELREVSEVDGCGNVRFFLSIVVPLSKALIAVMVLFYAVIHWNSYFNAMLYLKDESRQNLQLLLRQILIVEQANVNDISASMSDYTERMKSIEQLKYGLIVVASLPMMVIYPFVQKHFVKGVMVGAVKG